MLISSRLFISPIIPFLRVKTLFEVSNTLFYLKKIKLKSEFDSPNVESQVDYLYNFYLLLHNFLFISLISTK